MNDSRSPAAPGSIHYRASELPRLCEPRAWMPRRARHDRPRYSRFYRAEPRSAMGNAKLTDTAPPSVVAPRAWRQAIQTPTTAASCDIPKCHRAAFGRSCRSGFARQSRPASGRARPTWLAPVAKRLSQEGSEPRASALAITHISRALARGPGPCPGGTSDNSPAIYRWESVSHIMEKSRRDG